MQSNILEKALLVGLSIGLPGNTRKDRTLTEKVQAENSLGKSGRWLKQLYPCDAYDKLTSLAGEIRQWNYEHSLCWPDEGFRLLPSAAFMEYEEQMRAYRQRFEEARDTFLSQYNEHVQWARREHNGTFNAEEYPGAESIKGKFRFRVDHRPVPAGDQFSAQMRSLLGPDAQALDDAVQSALSDAHKDLWHRLASPLKHLVSFIRESDGKGRTRWCDSLVENVRDIAKLIPALNLHSDSNLESLSKEIAALLAGVSSQALKDDCFTRKDVAQKADAILSKMAGYMPQA